jgi:hypothetical protein
MNHVAASERHGAPSPTSSSASYCARRVYTHVYIRYI